MRPLFLGQPALLWTTKLECIKKKSQHPRTKWHKWLSVAHQYLYVHHLVHTLLYWNPEKVSPRWIHYEKFIWSTVILQMEIISIYTLPVNDLHIQISSAPRSWYNFLFEKCHAPFSVNIMVFAQNRIGLIL